MREGPLGWAEVRARHGSRRGIHVTAERASVLLDFGLSPYVNRRDGARLHYMGEGTRGDQAPTGGNAGLLACLESGRAVRVFERVRPGGWYDLGPHAVRAATYDLVPGEGRRVFEFVLEPAPGAG